MKILRLGTTVLLLGLLLLKDAVAINKPDCNEKQFQQDMNKKSMCEKFVESTCYEKPSDECSKIQKFFLNASMQAEAKIRLSSFSISWASAGIEGQKMDLDGFHEKANPKNVYDLAFGKNGNGPECKQRIKGSSSTLADAEIERVLAKLPCKLNSREFILYSLAKLPGQENLDIWSISQKRDLIHVEDGNLPPF